MEKYLSIIANSILFLGSLILLIDIAPSDLTQDYLKQKQAINLLEEHEVIAQPILDTNFNFESGKGIIDYNNFIVLRDFVKRYSSYSNDINWDRVIGIGYSKISVPIYNSKLEAIKPLFVALMPNENDIIPLMPIGELYNLNEWLELRHHKSLINTAIVFLVTGFFVQFWSSILSLKYTNAKVSGKNKAKPKIHKKSKSIAPPKIQKKPDPPNDQNKIQ